MYDHHVVYVPVHVIVQCRTDTGHKALCPVSRHVSGILMLTEPGILGVS